MGWVISELGLDNGRANFTIMARGLILTTPFWLVDRSAMFPSFFLLIEGLHCFHVSLFSQITKIHFTMRKWMYELVSRKTLASLREEVSPKK